MTTSPVQALPPGRRTSRISARRAREAAEQAGGSWLRRIVVLGSDQASIVEALGGWIYDQGRAGWNVVVPIRESVDDRPLRILGALATDQEAFLAGPASARRSQMVVADPDLCVEEHRLMQYVSLAAQSPAVEVRFWNDGRRDVADAAGQALPYRLSHAARAFKTQALLAASVGGAGVTTTEHLLAPTRRDSGLDWPLVHEDDLRWAGV